MMLSPWFPPRYLWAAIEGAGGLDLSGGSPSIQPRLSPDWKWLGVRNVPFGEKYLTWFAVRVPELRLYSNFRFQQPTEYIPYDTDITYSMSVVGGAAVGVALRQGPNCVLFIGNTADRTITTAVSVSEILGGVFAMHTLTACGRVDRGQYPEHEELRMGFPSSSTARASASSSYGR